MLRVSLPCIEVAPILEIGGVNRRALAVVLRDYKLVVFASPEYQPPPLAADDLASERELEIPMAEALMNFSQDPADCTVDRQSGRDVLNAFRCGVRHGISSTC